MFDDNPGVCVITGLASGSMYSVDVVAANSAGTGGPSSMKPNSPGNAGSPPSSEKYRPFQIGSLSRKAPASTAGKKILGYRAGAYGPILTLLSYCKTTAKLFTCSILKLK